MSKPDILMTAPMLPGVIAALDDRFTLHRLWQAPPTPEGRAAFLAEVGPAIRGVATSTGARPIGEDLLGQLPVLEIVSSFGVGYDHIDVPALRAHSVVGTNTPGVLDEEVADLTIGLLLATLRQIPQGEQHLRSGEWLKRAFPLSPTLRGRTVGILGLGNIGKAVARRLEGFGVDIAYSGRHRQDGIAYAYYDSPLALAEAVDTLIVLTPGGAATRHLVNAEVLAALGPNGVLINVARGSVVDEAALTAALNSGTILAAGLDVFETEPCQPTTLLAHPMVVALPHLGSASVATRAAMGQLVVDNLVSWFEGRGAITPIPGTGPA